MTQELRILALDLSLTCSGVCRPDGSTELIRTSQDDGDLRLLVIRDRVRALLREDRPHVAVIEGLPIALSASGTVGQVHGAVKPELMDAGVEYAIVQPSTLKLYATGHGRADKSAMAQAALDMGFSFTDDKGGDQCDAWWLWTAAHDWYLRYPAGARPPGPLDKAVWPTLPAGLLAA